MGYQTVVSSIVPNISAEQRIEVTPAESVMKPGSGKAYRMMELRKRMEQAEQDRLRNEAKVIRRKAKQAEIVAIANEATAMLALHGHDPANPTLRSLAVLATAYGQGIDIHSKTAYEDADKTVPRLSSQMARVMDSLTCSFNRGFSSAIGKVKRPVTTREVIRSAIYNHSQFRVYRRGLVDAALPVAHVGVIQPDSIQPQLSVNTVNGPYTQQELLAAKPQTYCLEEFVTHPKTRKGSKSVRSVERKGVYAIFPLGKQPLLPGQYECRARQDGCEVVTRIADGKYDGLRRTRNPDGIYLYQVTPHNAVARPILALEPRTRFHARKYAVKYYRAMFAALRSAGQLATA